MTTKKIFLIISGLVFAFTIFLSASAQSNDSEEFDGFTGDYCAFTPIYTNMSMGNPNNNKTEVIKLQNFLINYFDAPFYATGYFGRMTKQYVIDLQEELGVNPIGIVGPKTLRAINNLCVTLEDNWVPGDNDIPVYTPSPSKPVVYPTNEIPKNCKIWYDGCNTCHRIKDRDLLACTRMACPAFIGDKGNGAYCKEYFSTTSPYPGNQTPANPGTGSTPGYGGKACPEMAMQCPNGQFVGPTGPNCAYVCPN